MDIENPLYTSLLQRLSTTSNSNEARLKLLERRLTGELPSPRSLTFCGHLQQSDLDDVSSSRLFQLPADSHPSGSKEAQLQQAARSSKKRKVSPDVDHQDQRRQQPLPARSPPFRQVANCELATSPVAKSSPRRKSPALASPLSSKLLQRNTINKYLTNRANNSTNGCLPVSISTQTDVSLQEQEQSMQAHLVTASTAAEEAQ